MLDLWVWDVVPIVCVNSATPKNKSLYITTRCNCMIVVVTIQYIFWSNPSNLILCKFLLISQSDDEFETCNIVLGFLSRHWFHNPPCHSCNTMLSSNPRPLVFGIQDRCGISEDWDGGDDDILAIHISHIPNRWVEMMIVLVVAKWPGPSSSFTVTWFILLHLHAEIHWPVCNLVTSHPPSHPLNIN